MKLLQFGNYTPVPGNETIDYAALTIITHLPKTEIIAACYSKGAELL